MYLTKLELQGFKTFAKKTSLFFLPPKGNRVPITSVVGPNGSGKSNLADAIRWVLGEQSLKLLRGKKSEDIIFSGSQGKSRSGLAEVSLTLNNEDHVMPIDFAEVTITRRWYRSGESDYLVNGASARLADIQLLLAQANVGQKSYSVVGQGMVDHILVSTPEERKAFFDDATGVRHLQLKRHEAMLKLTRTYENLAEVEMLLQEIEPRMRSLKRQVSRLEQREEVEKALRQMERDYYGTLWWQLQDQLTEVKGRFTKIDEEVKRERKGLSELETRVTALEKEERGKEKKSADLVALQRQYQELQNKRTKLRDEQFEIQKQLELSKVRAESNWSPLPLTKIIEEMTGVEKALRALKALKAIEAIQKAIEDVLAQASKLVSRLQRPSAEDTKPDPKLETRLKELQAEQAVVEDQLAAVQKQMESQVTTQKETHGELLQLERDLRTGQQKLHLLENQRNGISIELARLEERQNNLSREMDEQLYGRGQGVKIGRELAFEIRTKRVLKFSDTDKLYPEIQKLRYKLELIGGIDPETIKEFEETKTRFDFLDTQVTDLKGAVEDTEKIIDNLDEEIRTQSEKSFRDINKEFQRFFKILFGGGSCSLVKLTKEEVEEEEDARPPFQGGQQGVTEEMRHHEEDTSIEAIRHRVKEREDRVVGIDIQATPPGKKLKALNLLSGGERALASIALISAIMAVNPSPFVVLDEVDAALDEANTIRFAAILEELAKLTQFIIITHNRTTMEKADLLYGVTMGDDGISNLLSVKLEDMKETASARR